MNFKDKMNFHFSDDFYREEKICEFTVTEKQKKIWAVEIDLLNELLKVCKKHDIKLMVFAGTLLGTIRHKGFIPWDDDLDVCMLREDFDKLTKIASSEFKFPYFFQSAFTDRKYFFGYGRLRNSLTTGHILIYNSPEYNQGIFVDIYVCDGLVNDDRLLMKQLHRESLLKNLLNVYSNSIFTNTKIKYAFKKIIYFLLKKSFCKLVKYETVLNWYEKNLAKYTEISENVSTLTHKIEVIKKASFKKEEFDNIIYLPFEGISVPVPANYHEILTRMYGDYMEYPPMEERGIWHDGKIEYDPDIPYKEFLKG